MWKTLLLNPCIFKSDFTRVNYTCKNFKCNFFIELTPGVESRISLYKWVNLCPALSTWQHRIDFPVVLSFAWNPFRDMTPIRPHIGTRRVDTVRVHYILSFCFSPPLEMGLPFLRGISSHLQMTVARTSGLLLSSPVLYQLS